MMSEQMETQERCRGRHGMHLLEASRRNEQVQIENIEKETKTRLTVTEREGITGIMIILR